jgi:cholesterol transport system auxiliary component
MNDRKRRIKHRFPKGSARACFALIAYSPANIQPGKWGPTLLFVVAMLAGCSALQRESLVRQTFLLDPPLPAPVASAQQATLRVGRVEVAAPFRGKNFVYRTADLRYESDFYVEFLVPPASMLAEQTARALVHARPFTTVAGPGNAIDAQWVLDGFASAIYADYRDKAKPAAELDIAYYLTSTANAEQTPRWTREYRQRVAMREATPQAYAEALNKAFGMILADLAHDLGAAQL